MMKKYISIILAALAMAGTGCKKNYLDLSTNPNSPISTTPQLALTGALKTTADITNGGGYTMYACWMGTLSWSTGYQANVALESYQIQTTSYDVFTPLYANLSNYQAVEGSTTEPFFKGIAEIMSVFDYQALVDNYNNVPYSQALKGTSVLNPAYDNGSVIYDALLKRLDAAIVLIQSNLTNAAAVNPGSSDIMYGGDMTNWLKFANTLKLRIALRQSNVGTKTAALMADVAATQGIGYIDGVSAHSLGALVNPGYLNSDAYGGQQSPLWRNYGFTQNGGKQTNRAEYQANTYGATALTSKGDIRGYNVYTVTTDSVGSKLDSTITSTPFGGTTPPAGTPDVVGTGLLSAPTMSAIIMSPSEALFLQAEAVQNGYITSSALSAAQLYNAGVEQSYVTDGLTIAQADKYLASNPYPGVGAVGEKAIIVEKWKALAIYGAFEQFNEYRRTGYPDDIPLSIYPGANPPNQITRIPYPAIEYKTNAGNVAAQGSINVFTSKIFWAK